MAYVLACLLCIMAKRKGLEWRSEYGSKRYLWDLTTSPTQCNSAHLPTRHEGRTNYTNTHEITAWGSLYVGCHCIWVMQFCRTATIYNTDSTILWKNKYERKHFKFSRCSIMIISEVIIMLFTKMPHLGSFLSRELILKILNDLNVPNTRVYKGEQRALDWWGGAVQTTELSQQRNSGKVLCSLTGTSLYTTYCCIIFLKIKKSNKMYPKNNFMF